MPIFAPDSKTYAGRARRGARLPVFLELPLEARTPIGIYDALRRCGVHTLLLESGKSGRYSYVALPDGRPFVAVGRELSMPDGSRREGDPFEALRALVAAEELIVNPLLRGFAGGYVGYLAYDMARHIERLPEHTIADPAIADCQFLRVDTFCQIDHDEGRLRLVTAPTIDDPARTYAAATAALGSLLATIDAGSESAAPSDADAPPAARAALEIAAGSAASLSQGEFEHVVERAREYIGAGDIFQVNLSVRFARSFDGDVLDLYRSLRAINPAPYMALFELPEMAIVSASPELLLRVCDGVIETRPIAGTRPRGASAEEDERNARKLASNEKERAEHLMLVDLERNDLGRVSRYGSVRVEEFMGIERYSHVIHIVSHIRGELADGRDAIDAIRACFPGGTITGAPKVRSMEIIEELEPHRRGVYTGSIGWLGFDGNAELNIAIRTIVVVDGIAYAQAGAGIVADSVPEHEYRESVRKAEAALEALERTRRSGS